MLKLSKSSYAGLAQLGEHLPYKQGATGSSPVSRTKRHFQQSYKKLYIVGSNPTPAVIG